MTSPRTAPDGSTRPDPAGAGSDPAGPDGAASRRTWADGTVVLDVEGAFATVTLADPARRNAQNPATWRALADVGRTVPAAVRVVVLRAEGPSFSAGLDRRMFGDGVPGEPNLTRLAEGTDAETDAALASFQDAFLWWRRPDLVSIAAVHGHAVGAGFQLALACDLRVAAQDARFAMRETSLGLVPDLTGTKPLVDLLGYERALEICLTGRWVDAAEAHRIGLVATVVPPDRLDETVRGLADAILAAPRDAVIETKALLLGAATRDLDAQRAAERQAGARRVRDLAGLGE